MPRANRHFLPGYIWHITHRCHQKKFLLKFARDRRRYLHWVFEAKKRFGLSVQLHGDIQSRPSLDQRYGAGRHSAKHAIDCRPGCPGIENDWRFEMLASLKRSLFGKSYGNSLTP